MKKILISSLFILLSTLCFSQGKFTGVVMDSLTQEPLEGASISINYGGKRTGELSDKNGAFAVPIIQNLENVIRIRYTGYVPKWIVLPPNTVHLKDTILLTQVVNTLEQVVISSKGFEENIKKPVLGANSINIKTLKEMPSAFGEVDLFRSLQMLPGVSSVGEASNGVNIRGGTVDQNLILLDDMPIFNPTHLFGLLSITPPDVLQNIDLYKGNVPARFGGRVASVMDISLRNPDPSSFSMKGGLSFLSEKLTVNVPVIKDKAAIYGSFRSSFRDWVLPRLDSGLENIRSNFSEGVIKSFWRIGNKSTLSTTSYLNDDFFETDLLTDLPNIVGSSTFFEYQTANHSAKWVYFLNSNWDIQASVVLANYRPDIATRERAIENTIRLRSEVNQMQYKISTNYQAEKLKVETGLNSIRYTINPGELLPGISTSVNPITTPIENAREHAIHTDIEVPFNPKFTLSTGLRYSFFQNLGPALVRSYRPGQPRDDFSILNVELVPEGSTFATYHGAEPRLGLIYALDDFSSIKFGYNLMRQYLQIVDNTTTPIPTSRWKTADTHIKPQISQLYTAGYYKTFKQKTYELTAELYYRSTQNLLDYKPGADFLLQSFPETQLVQGLGNAYGLELMYSKTKGKFTGWANYTFARSFIETNEGLTESERVNNGLPYPTNYDRPHTINSSVAFNIDDHNSFSFNFTYSSGRPYTEPEGFVTYLNALYPFYDQRNNQRIPAYHRLDFSWNIKNPSMKDKKWKGNWAFSVYNLYARRNVYSVFFRTENSQTKAFQLQIFRIPIVSLAYNFSLDS